MANLKRPELKLGGNMSENFKNFELRFHDYCIQANYRNTPPKGHTYSPAQRMVSRRTRTMLPTPDHLLERMLINRDTVSAEIKAKRNASKAHYDKTAGPEHDIINIGEFVYARPLTSKPGNPWAYGRVAEKRHSRSYTIQTPHSTIR